MNTTRRPWTIRFYPNAYVARIKTLGCCGAPSFSGSKERQRSAGLRPGISGRVRRLVGRRVFQPREAARSKPTGSIPCPLQHGIRGYRHGLQDWYRHDATAVTDDSLYSRPTDLVKQTPNCTNSSSVTRHRLRSLRPEYSASRCRPKANDPIATPFQSPRSSQGRSA